MWRKHLKNYVFSISGHKIAWICDTGIIRKHPPEMSGIAAKLSFTVNMINSQGTARLCYGSERYKRAIISNIPNVPIAPPPPSDKHFKLFNPLHVCLFMWIFSLLSSSHTPPVSNVILFLLLWQCCRSKLGVNTLCETPQRLFCLFDTVELKCI